MYSRTMATKTATSFGMEKMTKAPTRITKETMSLIDLFISTNKEKVIELGIYGMIWEIGLFQKG